MKTCKTLYLQITVFENLYRAYRQARRGKQDRSAVQDFEFILESNLLKLQEMLQNKKPISPEIIIIFTSLNLNAVWQVQPLFMIGWYITRRLRIKMGLISVFLWRGLVCEMSKANFLDNFGWLDTLPNGDKYAYLLEVKLGTRHDFHHPPGGWIDQPRIELELLKKIKKRRGPTPLEG